MKLELFSTDFEKYRNTTFHENPSNGSRVIPGGRTDMTQLIVAFRNFADAPIKHFHFFTIGIYRYLSV
jgi:hypothetical protein